MTENIPYSEFLDVGLLSRLPDLEIQARFLVSGFLSGLHRSPFRGFSAEFKEYRSYQPGDELKMIDWKIYARTDRLNLKLREEETNLSAYLIVDISASMNYRSSRALMSKWDYARALAAAFILFLQRQRDTASLALIGEGLARYIPPSLKVSDIHQMFAALHRKADAKICHLSEGLEMIAPLVRKRSLVLVFSDFYEDPARLEKPLGQLRHAGCEPMFFHVLDPQEIDFNFDEPVLLEELESHQQLTLSPDLLRKDYLKTFKKHNDTLAEKVHHYGGDYLKLRTDETPLHALGAYLAKRSGYL